jgi:hypothetical protein
VIGALQSLYAHYTSADTAFKRILLGGKRLRLSRYAALDDPLEAQDWGLEVISFVDQTPHTTREERDAATAAVRAAAQTLKERIRVLCLTTDADLPFEQVGVFARCYARPRMWEHRANHHEGVCLLLSASSLDDAMIAKARAAEFGRPGPVKYTDTALHNPRGISGLKDWDRHRDQGKAVEEYVRAHWDHYLFTKLADWTSEHEYRLAILSHADADEFLDCDGVILGVVLGHRFPSSQIPAASSACEEARVKLWRIDWGGGYPTTEDLPGGNPATFSLTLEP